MSDDSPDEILSIAYHSCDLVLEVNVEWRDRFYDSREHG